MLSSQKHSNINAAVCSTWDKGYRYGFNGEEIVNEISGDGMVYDLGFRHYESRLGRMFSRDPLEALFEWQSTYAYCYNNPIWIVDYKGMGGEPTTKHTVKKGESLSSLAKKNNTTVGAIKDANKDNIDWNSSKRTGNKKDWIYAGETLNIPTKVESSGNQQSNTPITQNTPPPPTPEKAAEMLSKVDNYLGAATLVNSTNLYYTSSQGIKKITDLKSFSSNGGTTRMGFVDKWPSKFHGNTNTVLKWRGVAGTTLNVVGKGVTFVQIGYDAVNLASDALDGTATSEDATKFALQTTIRLVCLTMGPAGWVVGGVLEMVIFSDSNNNSKVSQEFIEKLKQNSKDNCQLGGGTGF
ncbi:MAG: RHS repeat-associated core domain-containing protein [Bacteroidota bacterium]|nr:RHS repeat-associated core domain-containing protein [Bacteroidota bacterium]